MGFINGDYTITYSEQEINGRIHPVLELTGGNRPIMHVTVDPDTGLVQMVDGIIQAGSRKIIMAVGLGDYRDVGGVKLPYRIVNYVNGIAIAESRYDSVTVNADLAPDAFKFDLTAGLQ